MQMDFICSVSCNVAKKNIFFTRQVNKTSKKNFKITENQKLVALSYIVSLYMYNFCAVVSEW